MPDYAVHVTIFNQTSERLDQDPSGTKAIRGHWVDLPLTIPAKGSADFQIADDAGLYGSEAKNAFFVRTSSHNNAFPSISTHKCCPTGISDNRFEITKRPSPEATYTYSFQGKAGDSDWKDGFVPTAGHPVWVELTIKYQQKRYRFKLVAIAAVSGHPVRNSRNNLITGSHTLWHWDTASSWADGVRGSFAPNIFRYTFDSPVHEAGHLNVTVQPLDLQLIGAEVILYGSIDGKRILQTDYFFLKSLSEVGVSAHFIDPPRSSIPFDRNNNISWEMRLRQSGVAVDAIGPSTTCVELYWLSQTTHPAFWNGIPVGLLRAVFSTSPRNINLKEGDKVDSSWYPSMTEWVFSGFNKHYDTCGGASAFNMTMWGGIFSQSYYLAIAPGSDRLGTLYRTVNCFDQAGMLELICSLGENNLSHPTSWLLQQPFGFIRETKLVGIDDPIGQNLIDINNPFFGTDRGRALIGNNDPTRTGFHCHVFVGHSKPFNPSEAIYDACAGPHTGTENAALYLETSRQEINETDLYHLNNTYPGQVNTIWMGNGVTGIDGIPIQFGDRNTMAQTLTQAGDMLTQLVDTPAHLSEMAIIHLNWAHVDSWITNILDGQWSVAFKTVEASKGNAHVFWHLAGEDDAVVRITVDVETIATGAGEFDVQHSADAARDDAALLLYSTERHPSEVWTRGELSEFGDYTYQYSSTVPAGRCVIVAGNTVVDIAGGESTAALVPIARQLLGHVVQRGRDAHVPILPVLSHGRVVSLIMPLREDSLDATYNNDDHSVTIHGTDARLTLEFQVSSEVSVASATSEGGKVLLDEYVIENAGEQSKVRFVLVARELGTHATSLHVAHDETLATATYTMHIKVE